MPDSWTNQSSGPAQSISPENASPAGRSDTPNLSVFRDNTSPPNTNKPPGPPRIRRRNRVINSCLECRRRKLKCDKQSPCSNCTKFRRDCLFLAPALDHGSQQKLADIKERMGALEKGLEREVASKTGKQHLGGANVLREAPSASGPKPEEGEAEEEEDVEEDEEALEPTPLAALDAGYEDNGDNEMMDLGVQMGKMRITDRIGGWIRPKLVDELNDTLRDVKAGKSRWSASPLSVDHRQIPGPEKQVKLQANPKSYIGPGPDYIAPGSGFIFPGSTLATSLMDYLPSRSTSDQLIAQYFHAVHPVAKIVHRQTLEAQYTLFWDSIATHNEPLPSLQAIIFAAMFSAAVSLTDNQVSRNIGVSRTTLIGNLRSGAEVALGKAHFLRTTKVDTMQAFVMYLIPLVRAEVSRAHSALVGTAIRLAECMGLHRDGSHYSMTPIEIHVRRMIWHQLCFLDSRTCEATGPRLQIRKEDYDTRFPTNIDDADLINPTRPIEDAPYWTDNTLFRVRAECIEMRRHAWFDIIALDRKKKTLTSVLVRVQKFRNSLEGKFLPMIDDNVPLQALARHIIALGMNGLYIQILNRYLFSTTTRMPDRLRQVLIESGLAQMENAIQLETVPGLAPWSWYKGAFNQYHSALLLMVEVYAYPMRKDAAKIWKCLDYIFDIPPHLSPKQKAELVITDLRDRMEIFYQMRRVRSTTQMEARVNRMSSRSSVRPSGPEGNLVDSLGQQAQSDPPMGAPAPMPMHPVSFDDVPPNPRLRTDSSDASSSQQGGVPEGANLGASVAASCINDMLMEDIDWNEWDKYFPVETNTGDLNIPDFNFSDFTGGGFGSSTLDPGLNMSFDRGNDGNTGTGNRADSGPADMSDINFPMTYYPSNFGVRGRYEN